MHDLTGITISLESALLDAFDQRNGAEYQQAGVVARQDRTLAHHLLAQALVDAPDQQGDEEDEGEGGEAH